jgi:hypothetical protein
VARHVEEVRVTRKLVPERVGADEMGRGEDVGRVQRDLPGLRSARNGVFEPIQRAEEAKAFGDERLVAGDGSALEKPLDEAK